MYYIFSDSDLTEAESKKIRPKTNVEHAAHRFAHADGLADALEQAADLHTFISRGHPDPHVRDHHELAGDLHRDMLRGIVHPQLGSHTALQSKYEKVRGRGDPDVSEHPHYKHIHALSFAHHSKMYGIEDLKRIKDKILAHANKDKTENVDSVLDELRSISEAF